MSAADGIQSILFVPGNRPERFAKALAADADLICIDLEDAVQADAKRDARTAVLACLAERGADRIAVRINGLTTRDGLADLLALAEAPVRPRLLFLPKVEAAAELMIAASVLGDPAVGLVPLVETAEGMMNAAAIARGNKAAGIMLGGADYAAELGVPMSWEALFAARSAVVQAAARAGIVAIDVPFIDIADSDGLAAETTRIRALGFGAKAAIHPSQIEAINRIFRPSDGDVAEARAAVAAYVEAKGAAVRFNGKLLEAPLMRRYRRILAAAGETGHA